MRISGRLDVTILLLRALHLVVPGMLEALHLPSPHAATDLDRRRPVSAASEELWHMRSHEELLMESSCAISAPHHRTIIALDIEMSTSRTDPVKAELRNKLYELFDAALYLAGIHRRHRDRFIDRGDGILALIHPVDKAPKTILLNRVIPALNHLLSEYNASLPRASRAQRLLRVRVVVHAGEVHYDANGCFGEALDVAFRLLDAAQVKRALQGAAEPLILVVSGDIYRSVVRHGYDGIDQHTYHPLVRVQVAGNRYPGWVHLGEPAVEHRVPELANYRKLA